MTNQRLNQLFNFLKEDPDDSFVLFAIAKEYENLEDYTHGFQFYITLLEKNPQYIGVYFHLGKLYEKNEQITEALAIYEKGIEVAKKLKDQHNLAELLSAKANIEY